MSKEKHDTWREMYKYDELNNFSKPNRTKSKTKVIKKMKIKDNR